MSDKSIGREYPPLPVEVEKRWAGNCARAIGDDNPIEVDEKAAKESGHRTLPAPPTRAFAMTGKPLHVRLAPRVAPALYGALGGKSARGFALS